MDERELQRFWRHARRATGAPASAGVKLVSDTEMRLPNRTFCGKNNTTDVLSFPGRNDVAISLDTAAPRRAAATTPPASKSAF